MRDRDRHVAVNHVQKTKTHLRKEFKIMGKNNKKSNIRMNYPKPISSIASYVILLFSLVLIMAIVYGIDVLVVILATKFF